MGFGVAYDRRGDSFSTYGDRHRNAVNCNVVARFVARFPSSVIDLVIGRLAVLDKDERAAELTVNYDGVGALEGDVLVYNLK